MSLLLFLKLHLLGVGLLKPLQRFVTDFAFVAEGTCRLGNLSPPIFSLVMLVHIASLLLRQGVRCRDSTSFLLERNTKPYRKSTGGTSCDVSPLSEFVFARTTDQHPAAQDT